MPSDLPIDLPAIRLARAYPMPGRAIGMSLLMPGRAIGMSLLAAGIPLTLLLDLAAGEDLDSAQILAAEQATALVRTETVRAAAERAMAYPTNGESAIA